MADLSVICAYVNEHPQISFTIRAIAEDLLGRADFEIIAVNNYATGCVDRLEDGGGSFVDAAACDWLKSIRYTKKLSHWNAKRVGIEASSGKFLMFCDGHVVPSRDAIFNMYQYYREAWQTLDGSIHLPVTYKILESRRLIYKFLLDSGAFYDYRFTPFRVSDTPYEVPCMSTCGMLIHRDFYNLTGGWNSEFGIYGGGENFMNYTLSVLGKKKWIWPHGVLYHHGDRRGYSYNYDDLVRNRMIAHFLFGGINVLKAFRNVCKGKAQALDPIMNDVVRKTHKHRALIEANQKISIEEWVSEYLPTIH